MGNHKADYLIIGNSAAGITAAECIRAHDKNATVLMVSREPYPAYGRPLISYLIEGKTTQDKIWLKEAGFYENHNIETLFGQAYGVVKLEPKKHAAHLENGDVVTYGKCLLATGSVPFVPPIKGLEGRDNVYSFMTLDDAREAFDSAVRLNAAAHDEGRLSRIIVIGAGLIGLKAAEALSYHVDEVLVLELAPRILPAVLDDEGATILQELLVDHGIVCKPGTSADELLGEGNSVNAALLTTGETVDCDMVIAAVGVRPNSSLATDAGAEQGRGLICDESLMTTLPDVYAAGDVVQVTDILDGSQRPLALWPNAIQQGEIVALHMVGADEAEPYKGSFAVNAVDFFDASLLTAGIINPEPDGEYDVKVIVEDTNYTKFVMRDDQLVGYILLNRPTNAGIYTYLIDQKIPLSELDEALFSSVPDNLDFPSEMRWERLHRYYPLDLDERGWKERA